MYDYRKMSAEERLEAVNYRRLHEHPLHSPPHLNFVGERQFFVSGTCYEHKKHIGIGHERMTKFEADLLRQVAGLAVVKRRKFSRAGGL